MRIFVLLQIELITFNFLHQKILSFTPISSKLNFHKISTGQTHTQLSSSSATTASVETKETDVVIIGSGLAGLSCGALLSQAGYRVVVLESHDEPGGCCHSWERLGYHFESGPSLYSGFR